MSGMGGWNRGKRKVVLDEDQIKKLKLLAGYGLSNDKIATYLGIRTDTFEQMCKRDAALRLAIELGKAEASTALRQSAYQQAVGDPQRGIKPSAQMAIFLLKTREGFRETVRMELTGENGGPIKTQELTVEQRKATLKKLKKFMDITEDEK